MCPHIVDGRVHSDKDSACGLQSAARWSARSRGAHVRKKLRQRRAILLSVRDGTTDTERVPCDPQGACGLPKSGQESHRACAQCHSGNDFRVNTRKRLLAAPKVACHAVCAPSFSSWASFNFRRLTAVRKPTCQAMTRSCGRDRGMTASASAVTLRSIPQCDGESINSTKLLRFIKGSSTIQISSVTRSRMVNGQQNASIADRESVATKIRVGDWDVSGRGGIRCLKPLSMARHSALYEHASLPPAARWTSAGRSFVMVESYNGAADQCAGSAREEGLSIHNSKSQSPREE
ncbi:hypothetical protein TcCL_NonESM07007 [Trypanosoma cruzi]|nr:hypothetical protein TcCL_NonESM07007 [Trypanosoma cruzi]